MTRPHDEACEDMGEEQYQTLMGINMKGVGLSSQAEARAMLAHGQGGSIVNIASMAGVIVNRGLMQVHYNASKAGVVHMSKSMAMEWVDLLVDGGFAAGRWVLRCSADHPPRKKRPPTVKPEGARVLSRRKHEKR